MNGIGPSPRPLIHLSCPVRSLCPGQLPFRNAVMHPSARSLPLDCLPRLSAALRSVAPHYIITTNTSTRISRKSKMDDDLSFSDLSLLTSPAGAAGNATASSSTSGSAALRSRPSTMGKSAKASAPPPRASEANLRLLQGLNKTAGGPPVSGTAGGGGGNKRRVSLFAPSAIPQQHQRMAGQQEEEDEAEDDLAAREAEADDSILATRSKASNNGGGGAGSRGNSDIDPPPLPSLADFVSSTTPAMGGEQASGEEGGEVESKENVQRQLADLARLNASFEAYERMLQGSAGQIEVRSPPCLAPTLSPLYLY